MINPQCLELPMSQTNFNGPKDVRAIENRLYETLMKFLIKLIIESISGQQSC